jgi:hypothetical protein
VCLKSDGLRRDLQLWSLGLFPFFEYAATSAKVSCLVGLKSAYKLIVFLQPILLNMFETHYIPLQDSLRPIMKSFILCLLPGLEEETGEYFDKVSGGIILPSDTKLTETKVLGLLDQISGTVSPSFFLQNVWLIMLTTPPARHTSLNFLSRRLPRMKPEDGANQGYTIRSLYLTSLFEQTLHLLLSCPGLTGAVDTTGQRDNSQRTPRGPHYPDACRV